MYVISNKTGSGGSLCDHKDYYAAIEELERVLRGFVFELFGLDMSEILPTQNILSDLGFKFSLADDRLKIIATIMASIHITNSDVFRFELNPRELVCINLTDTKTRFLENSVKMEARNLEELFESDNEKKTDKDNLGGGSWSKNTPINGAKRIYVSHIYTHSNTSQDYQWIAGHAHTLFQFFAPHVLNQALKNIHYLGSTIYNNPTDYWELMSRHTGVEIVHIFDEENMVRK